MKNTLALLIEKIHSAPVWVQEVIYYDIKNNLEEKLPSIDFNYKDAEIYPIFKPQITFKGKKELEEHSMNLDINVYKCLNEILKEQRIIDITLSNFWTLEETSKCIACCIDNELIYAPQDNTMCAAIYYIAGEIRIGEYVKRINKINVEQLDDLLRKQKEYNIQNPNSQIKTGELMVSMGYVANMDIDKILFTKDEAKKRFVLTLENDKDINIKPVVNNQSVENEIVELNKKLQAENKILKDKLRQIFNIQNKNKN